MDLPLDATHATEADAGSVRTMAPGQIAAFLSGLGDAAQNVAIPPGRAADAWRVRRRLPHPGRELGPTDLARIGLEGGVRNMRDTSTSASAGRAARMLLSAGLAAALLVACSAADGTTSPAGSSARSTPAAASGSSASGSGPSQDVPVPVRPGEAWIVYQLYSGGSFHVRLIRPDGTADHNLLPDSVPATQGHPDWSPDGSRIVFTLDGPSLWTVDVDGTNPRRLPIPCDSTCEGLDTPAWSPDGRTIAFMRQDHPVGKDPYQRVQQVDVRTGAVTTLYSPPHGVGTSWLRWAPDGRSLVLDLQTFPTIDSDVASGSAIATVDLTTPTAKARPLTRYSMFAAYPDWSPRGDRIVFSTYDLGVRDAGNFADMTPPSDLYTIRPDGTGLTQLTHNPTGSTLTRNGTASGPLSTQPTWSPDGRSIIFVQVDGPDWPGWQMATMKADGSGLAPAVATGFRIGTHPRLRPLRG